MSTPSVPETSVSGGRYEGEQQDGPSIDVATQRLARPAILMALGTALSRVTGLGRIIALAFALGVTESRVADAYNLANTLPNILYELVLGGVLTSVFIPVVVQEFREKDEKDAWRSVSVLVSVAGVVLLTMTVATVLLAPFIVDLFTSRVPSSQVADQRAVATYLLRAFAPQIALYGFIAIVEGLLNAHGRFAAPMFAPVVNNLLVIGMFLAFAFTTADTVTTEQVQGDVGAKLLLGLGTTGGVAAMLVVLMPSVRRLPGRLSVRVDLGNPALLKLVRLSAWALVYVIVNAAGVSVSFYLAGGVQGGLTAYSIAFAFFQLPVGILAISIVTALVPKLSAQHIDGSHRAFRAQIVRGVRITAALMLPATAALLVFAEPLVQVLLQHGLVTGKSTELVAATLRAFAVGLLPFAAFQLLMRAFYARQDARTPALINVVENAVTVALDLALFPSMGVQGLALAHSLGYVVGALTAWATLTRSRQGDTTTPSLPDEGVEDVRQ